ncbi:MAG: nitrite/sulfite reductase [Candidatus Latescibacteria bacterium]|nr:nitrite/sulfite reductase [Candidatus Latescibacterota bacterium]
MSANWKQELGDSIAADLGREIDQFEGQIDLRKQDKIEERLFAETRLRRGVYGQRYDNGKRFDGIQTQTLDFPEAETKGPDTMWDAPGMVRIKIPFGGLNADQMDVLADLAEEYSDAISHITTRQDVQLHYVHIDDTPDLMRRLAAVGITTREACGNSVRNVTACPLSGVCRTESFDVTPYAHALMQFLLGHPDAQDFGRKFKIAFSGCAHEACGLANMHDMGAVAVERQVDGKTQRGFTLYVGGGLGAVPHEAKIYEDFLPEEELLPTAQAICRVFARLGEKRNRARARVKFLIAKLGIEEFRRLIQEERQILPEDPAWTAFLADLHSHDESPLRPALSLNGQERPEGFDEWQTTNVYPQRQQGYVVATIALPLGDLTSDQLRALATLCRRYVKDTVRATVEQNIVLRWVSEADLPALYSELQELGLHQSGAGTIVDVTACPGTDTCKLGISSSRGLAAELRTRLAAQSMQFDQSIKDLRIKISGCFNSCGQHHVADLGFYGISRKAGDYNVPHFQVVLGGQWSENAGSFGLPMGAVPSKQVPAVVERLTSNYIAEREKDESFQAYIRRLGKRDVKAMLDDLTKIPDHDEDASFYTDWGDTREFTTGDMGKGECAGEVVPLVNFELSACEQEALEAQVQFDEGHFEQAYKTAYSAMLHAAKALVKTQFLDVPEDPDTIVAEFRTRFYDTELFWDPYAHGKFANYLLRTHETQVETYTQDLARSLTEEASLFIEAAYRCFNQMSTTPTAS